MAHSADKVAVSRGDCALTLGKDTHVSAEAGSAGRGRNDRACLNEYLKQTFSHRLQIYFLCAGEDYASYALGDLLIFHYRGGGAQ